MMPPLSGLQEVFLPQGYPDTVSSDYLSYQMWDTLQVGLCIGSEKRCLLWTAVQAFCSSITGMLATLAILKGVGVGDSTATPLAAALTWMFKGMPALPLHPHTLHHCDVCMCM